jgi:hypothetical protein
MSDVTRELANAKARFALRPASRGLLPLAISPPVSRRSVIATLRDMLLRGFAP